MKSKTLLLIKPDAVQAGNIGEIIKLIEDDGFTIEQLNVFHMEDELAAKFYAEHLGKEFYDRLVKFMQRGNVIGLILKREDAVNNLRELIGNTDSSKAASGTIRNLFGNHDIITSNAVHASDCPESAKREIGLIFPEYKY